MMHLMRLEWKKVRFLHYILISAVVILLGMFFVFVGLNDSAESKYTFESAFRAAQLFFAFAYVIFFAVLVSALVISEYDHKTILLMFTYPIDRKKLIVSKLLIITLFMVISMLLGYLACGVFIVEVDRQLDLVAGIFTADVLKNWIYAAVSSTIVFCCLGLWSFAAGMVKKSVAATIVSSILFIYLRQIVIAASDTYQENIGEVVAALVITFVVLRYTFAKKVVQIDS